jgi:hypothetical protein
MPANSTRKKKMKMKRNRYGDENYE